MGKEIGWSALRRVRSLANAGPWLNSAPLTLQALRGKVVMIDFWTCSCINCLRALPYVRAWASRYARSGLVVIGVHTPEFAFEKSVDNVRSAVKRLKIDYPVVMDNDRFEIRFLDPGVQVYSFTFG